MAHQVGNAVRTAYDHTLGSSGLGLTGQDSLVSNAWDTYTGKLDDPLKVGWENQAYNQDWDTQGQNYNANTLGNAQGYTAQGYTGQGYDATQGNATMGNYQTGQDFSGIMGQAMDASRQFMDPSSDWAKGQQSILAETTGPQAGQAQAHQNKLDNMLKNQSVADDNADRAAKRDGQAGQVVRRTIALCTLFAVIFAPFILAFFNEPVTIEANETGGLIGFLFGELFSGGNGWIELNGYVLLPEVRQTMLALVGFYFGSSQVKS